MGRVGLLWLLQGVVVNKVLQGLLKRYFTSSVNGPEQLELGFG